jgi:2-polyprenyl-6-methoxyphenol hydroxylase-like FAD-dependent oxidoreductase
MPPSRVLVCGAGVAGSTVAYWLGRHDFQVVVVERSKAEQSAGQGIDIEGSGVKIVKMMGVLEKIEKRTTGEEGFSIVDEEGRPCGIFKAGIGPTRSIEIMRGDLTDVLSKAADEFVNVTFHYETTIQSIRQIEEKVIVDLEDKSTKRVKAEEFDFVVGADGVGSRTRQLVTGPPEELNCLKSVNCFSAYFSISAEPQDWPNSRLCQFSGRRTVCIRPTGKDKKESSAYLIHISDDCPSLLRAKASGNRQRQKEALAEMFAALGWEIPRVIEEMMKTENFYFDHVMQVKLQKWSQGRVVLLGDAAYAPSPLTGRGTLLALTGAFVLAQEMSRNRLDGPAAFEKYERRFRAYVEDGQNIPLWGYAPYLVNLQTSWGIRVFRTIARFLAWTEISDKIPASLTDDPDFDLELEEGKE